MVPISEISKLLDDYDYSGNGNPIAQLKLRQKTSRDSIEVKIIQTEIDCLYFSLRNGKLGSMYSTTDKTGAILHEYPTVKSFDQDALTYLDHRLHGSTNDRLKVRYAQILLNARKKGRGEALRATIDIYLRILRNKGGKKDAEHFYTDISNVLHLSSGSHYRVDEVKGFILKLISKDKSPYDNFYILVRKILSFKSLFLKRDLVAVVRKGEAIWKSATKLGPFVLERLVENSIAVSLRIGYGTKEWQNRLGEVYERAVHARPDDTSGMLAIVFCEKAIKQFQQAGNKAKVKELHALLVKLKPKLKLDTIEVKIPAAGLEEIYKQQDAFIRSLLGKPSDDILSYLANGPHIFPDAGQLRESVQTREKSFMDFVHITRFDINKNPSHKKGTATEAEIDDLKQEYSWHIQIFVRRFLRELFTQGFYTDKITFDSLVHFLHKKSWIGKEIKYTNSGGDPIGHTWLGLISPSLLEFYAHWQAYLHGDVKFQNFVLCIDSLTLKFEGILRDFAKIIGAETTVMMKGSIREAYIEELLSNPTLKEYFDESDLMLFKYLFTSAGENIRNNVAHSFYKFHHYTIDRMLIVITAVIRLSKYQVSVKNIAL